MPTTLYTTIAIHGTETSHRTPCHHCHAERSEASHRVTMKSRRDVSLRSTWQRITLSAMSCWPQGSISQHT